MSELWLQCSNDVFWVKEITRACSGSGFAHFVCRPKGITGCQSWDMRLRSELQCHGLPRQDQMPVLSVIRLGLAHCIRTTDPWSSSIPAHKRMIGTGYYGPRKVNLPGSKCEGV